MRRARQPSGAGSGRAGGKGRPSPPSGLPQTDLGVRRGGGGSPGAGRGSGSRSPIVSRPWLAGEGRGERGSIGGWKPCCGIPAQSRRISPASRPPWASPNRGDVSTPSLSPPGRSPRGTCLADRPCKSPFVPGKPDALSVAAPARCLSQRQLSWQLLSPHNGVWTQPPRFGSGSRPSPPGRAEDARGMLYFWRGKRVSPGTASVLVSVGSLQRITPHPSPPPLLAS